MANIELTGSFSKLKKPYLSGDITLTKETNQPVLSRNCKQVNIFYSLQSTGKYALVT
jgi:hypothetical protein